LQVRVGIRSRSRRYAQRGATSIQILVILVPVLFAFMGFAFDLGRLYLIRGELKTAATAMALAAAGRLNGTELGTTDAAAAARLAIGSDSDSFGNRYDFGGRVIGATTGGLTSEAPDPAFFDTLAAAIGTNDAAGGVVGGSAARYVRATVRADAPLTFWGFLSLGQDRRTSVVASAVAGMSAPLCTACGIDPIAVQAIDSTETINFGFTAGTKYSLGYLCTGGPQPQPLNGTGPRIPYLIINRLNDAADIFADESTQLYRIGASGLPPSADPARACVSVNAEEQVWATALPAACATNLVAPSVRSYMCGIASRFDAAIPGGCALIPEAETVNSLAAADTDIDQLDDYTTYSGTGRRVITVGVVQTLAPTGTMTIIGFRQFLLEPDLGSTNVNINDANGRFGALYIGSVSPVRQGRFDGCRQMAGPGKVVLHQ
jgi:Flp pilus assembly protein TadG